MPRPTPFLLALLSLALLAAPLQAQKLRDKSKPKNDPVQCPYCMGEPELMAASGLLNHGGFPFGKTDTAAVDKLMVSSDIVWAETAHFRIGLGLGPYKVEERKKVRAECEALAEVLEEVPKKPRVLDPWLRLHLYAVRLEQHYQDMCELLGVQDSDFPATETAWDGTGTFMGVGPFLGMPRKFEVLVLPSEGALVRYLNSSYGLTTKSTQRWHVVENGALQVVAHVQQGSLRKDAALHGHLVFNLTQNMLNAFKHYSYELPVWLMEGLGHLMERRLSPEYNSFNSSEGAQAEMTRKADWEPPTYKLIQSEKMPSFASLIRMRDFADLDLDRHYATWSVADYLEREHPGFLRGLLHAIKGMTDENNLTDGSKLADVQRAFFKDKLGVTYAQFDRGWHAWVLDNYSAK